MNVRNWGVFRLYHGDNLAVLRTLPDNSIDSIVTDPPYGLAFMGKKWDYDVPPVETWVECLVATCWRSPAPAPSTAWPCGSRMRGLKSVI